MGWSEWKIFGNELTYVTEITSGIIYASSTTLSVELTKGDYLIFTHVTSTPNTGAINLRSSQITSLKNATLTETIKDGMLYKINVPEDGNVSISVNGGQTSAADWRSKWKLSIFK